MNSVQLVGRLTKDPDLRYTAVKGTAVARFSVAVKKKIKDAEGNYGADFINCVAYGKIAENIANFFTKGNTSGTQDTGFSNGVMVDDMMPIDEGEIPF